MNYSAVCSGLTGLDQTRKQTPKIDKKEKPKKKKKRKFTQTKQIFWILFILFVVFKTPVGSVLALDTLTPPKAGEELSPSFDSSPTLEEYYIPLDNYLSAKGSPLAGQGKTFVLIGRQYGVDPDLLIAICGADSSLGNNLTTSFNPGNVGNTDSGGMCYFSSWEEGIDAIGKTLCNNMLSECQIIGDLSRGGGSTKPFIYATSSYNWNKNVLFYMSEIKGEQIDEGYKFRK